MPVLPTALAERVPATVRGAQHGRSFFPAQGVERWLCTALSNLAAGYDKYAGVYDKARLPRARFPDRTFTLAADEIGIGVAKARDLCARLGRAGDLPIAIETRSAPEDLRADHASGLGAYTLGTTVPVVSVRLVGEEPPENWEAVPLHDAPARSMIVMAGSGGLAPWAELRPRSLSLLPVGHACQASCAFCFSKASVSDTFRAGLARGGAIERLARVAGAARTAGAGRAVITGIVQDRGWPTIARLPWGAPVFAARHQGRRIDIAAYTEPSASWERIHGLARSWNMMADGQVLASLEDPSSRIVVDGF